MSVWTFTSEGEGSEMKVIEDFKTEVLNNRFFKRKERGEKS